MNNKITALNCNGTALSVSELAIGATPVAAEGVTPIEPTLVELSPVRAAIIGDDTCPAITARARAPALVGVQARERRQRCRIAHAQLDLFGPPAPADPLLGPEAPGPFGSRSNAEEVAVDSVGYEP